MHVTESDDIISYWNDDSSLPIHSTPKERISTEYAASIILDGDLSSEQVCSKQPTCVDKNCLFVVDLSPLKNPKDLACDDMGSWRLNKTYRSTFSIRKGEIVFSKQHSSRSTTYTLIRRYYYNKSSPDVNKTMCTVLGKFCVCPWIESMHA